MQSQGPFAKAAEISKTAVLFLFFFKVRPDLKRLGNHYLVFGLFVTWLAGVGRYWDNPRADAWQTWGLGSLAYVVVLAMLLWLLLLPLKPANWRFKNVLIFVGMTAPPGLLYAIPVERYFSLETSQSINVWFLAVVAAWRVALLIVYLIRSAGLRGYTVFVAAFLPLILIVSSLAMLNLEHVIFRVMAGLEPDERTANDAAYMYLLFLTWISFLLSPVLFISYLCLIWLRRKGRLKEQEPETGV